MNSCDQLKCFSGFVRSFKSRTTQITVRESGGMTHNTSATGWIWTWSFGCRDPRNAPRSLSRVDELCFRLAKAQVPLPYVLFAKKGSSEGRRHIHTFLILLPFLCKPCQLSVCVCVRLYIHILTHTDRRLCVCVCVYINQYICPAFPPCMDLRPFPLISCSTHWGITAQMEKLVNLFCSLFLLTPF